jgi:hypothetical protein
MHLTAARNMRQGYERLNVAEHTATFSATKSEQNGSCAYPNCPGRPSALLRIVQTEGGSTYGAVCTSHSNPDDELVSLLTDIARLRRSFSQRHPGKSAKPLRDRAAYLQAMSERLAAPSDFVYIIYAGPIPFHPQWYHDLRDMRTDLPNMDRAVGDLIRNESCEVRLIVGNFERYAIKCAELLEPALQPILATDTLTQIESMWPPDDSKVKICSMDTTLYDLPTVFDNIVIRAGRNHHLTPISDGYLTTDSTLVSWERIAFERLFDAAYRGNDSERGILTEIIRTSSGIA